MAEIVELGPHDRMTVGECLDLCARDKAEFRDVMVLGYDAEGRIMIRSSHMSRAEAAFMLLAALDHARGVS